ncbi:MAG: DNA-processing protein DprA, partial [Acidimicrobiales bacterium]
SGPDNQGIDAWAPPAAVVAGGVDVVYPRPNAGLWNRIAHQGVIVSESPRGFPHQAWRFPWRNRVIAALAQVVVVVESHQGGGSFYTVESAMRRGRPVLAVPGSIRSPASLGTNRLLRDGAIPALDVEDILVALDRSRTQAITPRKTRRAGQARSKPTGGWAGDEGGRCGDRPTAGAKTALSVTAPLSVRGPMPPGSSLSAHTLEHSRDGQVQEPSEGDEPLGATEKAVLESLDWEPIGLAVVIDRTSMSLGRVAFALELLESKGLARCRGSWWERS